jgi:hypothetical protein
MISGLSLLLNVTAYGTALLIALSSAFYTYRQRLTSYQLTRDFFFLIYIVVVGLMLSDLLRILTESPAYLSVYPLFSFGFGFIEAILLLTAAVGVYLRPNGSSYRLLLKDVRKHSMHFLMFLLFIVGTVSVEAYLAIYRPYTVVTAHDFAGGTIAAVTYSTTASVAVGILFFFFLAYPVGLLIAGALRVQNPQMKMAQLLLGIGFAVSSAVYVLSELLLFAFGIDTMAIAYLALSAFFAIIASNFRTAAVFAGFVTAVSVDAPQERAPSSLSSRAEQGLASSPGNGRASSVTQSMTPGRGRSPLLLRKGELNLLEVDTSIVYEKTLRELVADFLAEDQAVFLISAKGSRMHVFFSEVSGVKLYTMSGSTRYIAPSMTRSDEVNIPLFDTGVLLEVLGRTVGLPSGPSSSAPSPSSSSSYPDTSSGSTSAEGRGVLIILDSISDLVLYSGFLETYKFLREVAEMASETKATLLFLLFAGAHDEREVMAIRSVFASQAKVNSQGFETVR